MPKSPDEIFREKVLDQIRKQDEIVDVVGRLEILKVRISARHINAESVEGTRWLLIEELERMLEILRVDPNETLAAGPLCSDACECCESAQELFEFPKPAINSRSN